MKTLIDNQHKYQFIHQNGDYAYADDVGKVGFAMIWSVKINCLIGDRVWISQ